MSVIFNARHYAEELAFEASGEWEYSDYHGANRRSSFKIHVYGEQWYVKNGKNSAYPHLDSYQIGFNGTNLFSIDTMDESAFRSRPKGTTLVPANAKVTPGTFPPFNFHHTAQLWLAFLGGKPLATGLTNRLPCSLFRDAAEPDCTLKSQVRTIGSPPILAFAAGFNEGYTFTSAGKTVTLPFPYDKGYTNFIYSLVSHTNIGGLLVPTAFTFSTFYMEHGAKKATDLKTVWTIKAVVHRISTNVSKGIIPRIVGDTYVQDYRVSSASATHIAYQTTNQLIVDTNQEAFKRIAEGAAVPTPVFSSPVKVLVLVGTLSMAFLALSFWGRSRDRNKQSGGI